MQILSPRHFRNPACHCLILTLPISVSAAALRAAAHKLDMSSASSDFQLRDSLDRAEVHTNDHERCVRLLRTAKTILRSIWKPGGRMS